MSCLRWCRHALPLAILFGGSACQCDPPAPITMPQFAPLCEDATLENNVVLSDAFAAQSDVVKVRYTADLNSNVLQLGLFNAADERVGTLEDIQRISSPEQGEQGRLGSHLQRLNALELVSDATETNLAQHTLRFALYEEDVLRARIVGAFEDGRCAAPQEPGLLPCAGQLSDLAATFLPSCGLDYASRLGRGQRPQLKALRIDVPSETPIAGADGSATIDSQQFQIFEIVTDGVQRPDSEIEAFLTASALDAVLTGDDFSRIRTVAGDLTWSRVLLQHVDACLNGGFPTDRELVEPGQASGALNGGNSGSRSPSTFASPSSGRRGSSKGDPHLTTFDQHRFDFQAAGDFILARRTGPIPFEVQSRFAPLPSVAGREACEQVTWTTAAAIELDDNRVLEVSLDDAFGFALLLDGVAVDPTQPISPADSHQITVTLGTVEVLFEDGALVEVRRAGTTLGVAVVLPEDGAQDPHLYSGLLGNADGDDSNDLVGLSDQPLNIPTSISDLRDEFRAKWAVDEDTSLFTYAAGEGPDTFADPSRPERAANVDDIPLAEQADLRTACVEAGAQAAFLADCMLDLFCTPASASEADTGDGAPPPATTNRPDGLALNGSAVLVPYLPETDLETPIDAGACGAPSASEAEVYDDGIITLTASQDVIAPLSGERVDAAPTVTLPAGTTVRSILIAWRPQGQTQESLVAGGLAFDAPVLGLIAGEAINASPPLPPDGVAVVGAFASLRTGASVELSPDLRKLNFAAGGTDQLTGLRVLVEVQQ